MSAGMPELGSKISLISKADIRYEGRLFTVDPQECTIALASVRSFGTEERETQYPVPAQNQVYDYILFRGADIKDIRVINNVSTLPNDPAIMQLSVPPTLGQHQFHPQGYTHPIVGSAMGPTVGQFNTGYGGPGAFGSLAPGMGVAQGPRTGSSKPSSVLDFIGGASRSTTPISHSSRKSPTADQAVQTSGKKDDKRVGRPIQVPGRNQPRNDRRDSKGESSQFHSGSDSARNQNRSQNRPNQQMQNNRQTGWGPTSRGQPRNRGSRPRVQSTGGFRQNQQNAQQTGTKPKSTLKFENDYDFEQANTQFEELKNQFEKIKIKDGKGEVNGDNEKKDDSGNETGAGECEQEEDDQQVFYDKTKSFFDNISCEAVERSKGRSQRTDWRAERKLNSETFGVSSARRTGYRGRGGFYNNRGGYRTGYRGNYRPQGGNANNRKPQDRSSATQTNQSSSGAQTSENTNRQQTGVPVAGTK